MHFQRNTSPRTLLPTLNISLRESVRWLELTFFMACFEGVSNRKEWWSNSEPTRESGNCRHDPIDLAEGWRTKWWPNQQYSFFLALSEVNANACCSRAQDCPPEPQLEFRRKLALKMINNNLDDDGNNMPVVEAPKLRSYTQQILTDHNLDTRPLYANRWLGSKWKLSKTQKYPKLSCRTCSFLCRTYCACNKAVPMCNNCHKLHLMEV